MNEYKLTIIQKIESHFDQICQDIITTCDASISSQDRDYALDHAKGLRDEIGILLRVLAQPLDLRVKRRGKHDVSKNIS